MDLRLSGRTVMVLGPGDYLDRAIVRSVASEGAATLATTDGERHHDLAQQADGGPHWSMVEPHIDAFVASRLRRFLDEQGRQPDAVVLHIDIIETLTSRGPLRWWRFRKERRSLLRATAEAIVAAVALRRQCQVVLVYSLADQRERTAALRWLEDAMGAVLKRSRQEQTDLRVNAIVVGDDDAHPETADVVAMLCSPIAAGISGALIPIDNGDLANAWLDSPNGQQVIPSP